MSLATVAGPLGIILTFFGGVLLAAFTAFFARKKQRADTVNVEVNTENSVATTGLTVLQAVMLALQQENVRLTADRDALAVENRRLTAARIADRERQT